MTGKLLSRKWFFLFFGALLFLLQQTAIVNHCGAECFYVTGNMSADVSTEQTRSFQITGTVSQFSYRYFHPANYSYCTNSQYNNNFSLAFSLMPATQQEGVDEFGNSYTDLVWNGISNTNLDITITQEATTTAALAPLTGSDPFPVNQGDIPAGVQQYLEATDLVQVNDSAIKAKAGELVAGCAYQFQAVENIVKWLINNITYGMISDYDARSTLDRKKGVCENISHLACALLRAEGIPARYVSGVSLARSYSWSVGYSTYSSTWFTGSHAWFEVFYPELGWIPYDGQRDIHHIDVFRIKKAHGRDNHDLSGISWSYFSPRPSVSQSESSYVVDIKNDIIDIETQSITDEINSGNYALCLEVNPGMAVSPPVLSSLDSPTDQRVITVRGTAAIPGSMVEIFVNGQSAGTTIAASNGNFSLAGVNLTEGSNRISARSSLGGMTSELSPARAVVYQSPVVPSNSTLPSSTLPSSNLPSSNLPSSNLPSNNLPSNNQSTLPSEREANSLIPVVNYGGLGSFIPGVSYGGANSLVLGTGYGGSSSSLFANLGSTASYGYGGFSSPSAVFGTTGSFGYGGFSSPSVGVSPASSYNYGGFSSPSVVFGTTGSYGYSPSVGLTPTSSYNYGGFSSPSAVFGTTGSYSYGYSPSVTVNPASSYSYGGLSGQLAVFGSTGSYNSGAIFSSFPGLWY